MKRKSLILLILLPLSLLASNADSTQSVGGDWLNLGLSVGLGGSRPYYYLPQGRLKLGPLSIELAYEDYISHDYSFGISVTADLVEIDKRNKSSQTVITGSWGTSDFVSPQNGRVQYYTYSVLAGITRRPINKNFAYSFEIGGFQVDRDERLGSSANTGYYYFRDYIYSSRRLPYGEVSMFFNIGRNRGHSITLENVVNFDHNFITFNRGEANAKRQARSRKFKANFNPYLSIGAGRDRLTLYPNVGIMSKRFFVEGGVANALDGNLDWHLGAGYFLKDIDIFGLKFRPSVMLERKKKEDFYGEYIYQEVPPYSVDYVYTNIGFEETALFYGLNWRKGDSPISLRLNGGLGLFKEYRKENNTSKWTSGEVKSTKLRPTAGVSLVMNMFRYK